MKAAVIVLAVLLAVTAALALWRASDRRIETRVWTGLAARSDDPAGFDAAMVATLPEPARRYFLYTIAPGTPLRSTAHIEMTGEIGTGTKQAPDYRPMRARQLLAAPRGFVWQLDAGLIGGSDAMTVGNSWTRFWLAGILPVVRAGGESNHFRSAFGRVVAEGTFWTPAAFLPGPGIRWDPVDADTARVTVVHHGLEQSVEITVASDGQPVRVVLSRWSNANPEKEWRLQPFGGDLADFREFGGYRLPTRVEGGNLIGTEDYFPFFKARVRSISFDDLKP
ncbi:hypothetical protein KEU06_23640 [Pseudaminobacter sp. 19-2017]|uniref:Uncharacterized protein n=1 Tax=Pseudaminobacter soli (ex Zhang et al. 2022) TaxID=2831468 RepID=A0A942E1D3_9HYPH|nr:DUF6544 family protein [Pseudaminobacter soli]MBS3651616.1 hypothetical protein [Pseudaminobacter soli]